ncbi:uncharacterized protein F5891DRAFT_974582 [Suillus fuscotomentosus]|uniref:Uncharacterized protein n=1 Tax=Suillus fuscotomentosus TaxID=1912939 RepID=A0AAD4HS21_9AGAM|nr:uncharacterized protein F5891DRAFT_974582 [Suillus fuscotomentosus]KAG1907995.1 hypothetical protein F5891DRAFT_974582 [Suillus fuscotomentosus]
MSTCVHTLKSQYKPQNLYMQMERCMLRQSELNGTSSLILSIIGHAGEVERTVISAQHNLHDAPQKPSHRHAHMRTREEVGITGEAARNLEAFFAWTPPLSTEPRDADDPLAGLENISSDDVAAGFAALKELKRTEEV